MLFGHDDKIALFTKLVSEGELHHAYLFFGDPNIGKASFASGLARFLETRAFEHGNSVAPLIDVRIVGASTGTIGVDVVREVKQFLSQTPLVSSRRTAIIDNAHMLTGEAQSSALKMAEEPPSHGLIIFVTHSMHAFFPPLLSRLHKVYFSRLSTPALSEILQAHFKISKEKAERIAPLSFGRIGRALRLLGVIPAENSEQEVLVGEEIQDELVRLRTRDASHENVSLRAWLVEREMLVKRYSVNQNLQRKAVKTMISKHA